MAESPSAVSHYGGSFGIIQINPPSPRRAIYQHPDGSSPYFQTEQRVKGINQVQVRVSARSMPEVTEGERRAELYIFANLCLLPRDQLYSLICCSTQSCSSTYCAGLGKLHSTLTRECCYKNCCVCMNSYRNA